MFGQKLEETVPTINDDQLSGSNFFVLNILLSFHVRYCDFSQESNMLNIGREKDEGLEYF